MFERVNLSTKSYNIPFQTRIGHLHLKVSDIKKGFYQEMLGFKLNRDMELGLYFIRKRISPPYWAEDMYNTARF